jgi:predicted permease
MLAARREFGMVSVIQEHARDARGGQWMASVIGDLRHAVRHFARVPLMALTIVLTLTLGIGISSAAFGIVSGIFTRPAPGVPDDESLVTIRGIQVKGGQPAGRSFSYPELIEYAQRTEFTDVAGWLETVVVAGIGGQDVGTAHVRYVTPNFFRTLGLTVGPGRGFGQSRIDDHAEPEFTAVIGHQFAIVQFGIADSAVGKTIKLNGVSIEIVGVAPPRFLSVFGEGEISTLFLPVSAAPVVDRIDGLFTSRSEGMFWAVARLRGGLSIKEALPAVELVASRAGDELARLNDADAATTYTADVVRLRGDVQIKSARGRGEDLQAIALIVGLVLLILLVCTTTVSSLLVGSGLTRRHEIAVRLAMGASRPRIVRQLLTETALLSVVAGAAGLAVYALVYQALRDGLVDADFGPDWATALVTALVAGATSMLCGLSPALHATRGGVSAVLKDSAKTATVKSRLQRTFVVAQIALTQPLLVMLAMMIAAIVRQGDFANRRLAEHIVRANFDTWSAVARNDNRLPAIIERVAALPGVVAVIPQVSGVRSLKLDAPPLPDNPLRRYVVRTQPVAPGYFKGMDQRIVMGREFIESDSTASVSPIVIGSDFAARVFGTENPIGKRLVVLNWSGYRRMGEAEIVGVVSADDAGTSETGTSIRIFTPMGGALGVPMAPDGILIRTAGPAAPLLATFREIANAEAPMLPIRSMKTLAQMDREKRSEILQATGASAVGGLITLLLASVGLYAVVALAVNQRQREIGVRVSLGARPGQVVQMFFRGGLRVSLIGLAIGLPLSVLALKVLRSQMTLMGIPRVNMPVIASAVAVAVIVVSSLASWIPARRAAGADPLEALRAG